MTPLIPECFDFVTSWYAASCFGKDGRDLES
jgi:hypothetical protein